MSGRRVNFDLLARPYRLLEFLAFGGDLERARFAYLDQLAGCRDILLLGEGDGRCVERLRSHCPEARIHCVDLSSGMIARASRRLEARVGLKDITFTQGDARTVALEAARYDAVATFFFLDCFSNGEVERLVERIGTSLRPGAIWLFADFVVPHSGWRRLRGRLWLALLYFFFGMATGLKTKTLPDSETILARRGWSLREAREFQRGFVRSVVLNQPGSRS